MISELDVYVLVLLKLVKMYIISYLFISAMGTRVLKTNEVRTVAIGNKIAPVAVDNDANTLAEQTKTLKKIKLVCACLALLTVINSATLGGLGHTMVSNISFSRHA